MKTDKKKTELILTDKLRQCYFVSSCRTFPELFTNCFITDESVLTKDDNPAVTLG